MKKKMLAYAALPVLGLGLLGAGVASAHGPGGFGGFGGMMTATPDELASRQTQMFQKEADLLGVSVDDVKSAWASGKTLSALATEKGITASELQQKMQAARTAELKSYLATLVTKGVITQAQADQRLQFMQSAAANARGKMGRHMGFGL